MKYYYLIISIIFMSLDQLSYAHSYMTVDYGLLVADKFSYKYEDNVPKRPTNNSCIKIAVGKKVNDRFLSELSFDKFYKLKYKKEYTDRSTQYPVVFSVNQDVEALAIFINLRHKLYYYSKFSYYVNSGVGTAMNKAGDRCLRIQLKKFPPIYDPGSTTRNLAWNLGGDITYHIHDKLSINVVSYRYYSLGTVSTRLEEDRNTNKSSIFRTKLKTHVIRLGITMSF